MGWAKQKLRTSYAAYAVDMTTPTECAHSPNSKVGMEEDVQQRETLTESMLEDTPMHLQTTTEEDEPTLTHTPKVTAPPEHNNANPTQHQHLTNMSTPPQPTNTPTKAGNNALYHTYSSPFPPSFKKQ